MTTTKVIRDVHSGILRLKSAVEAFYRAAVDDYEDEALYWPNIAEVIGILTPDDEMLEPILAVVMAAQRITTDSATDSDRRRALVGCNQQIRAIQCSICTLRSTTAALKLSAEADEREKDLYWPDLMNMVLSLVPDAQLLDSVADMVEQLDSVVGCSQAKNSPDGPARTRATQSRHVKARVGDLVTA